VLELDERRLTPVLVDKDVCFVWIRVNNIYVVAVARGNPNVVLILTFLHKLKVVFEQYFKELEDESLRDNFVITYELLDEMMDFGYPQITEVKVLQEFIKTEAHKLATQTSTKKKVDKLTDVMVPTAASNVVSWRPEGIKHFKNEIFLDVIEKLNILVSANGTVLSSEIIGRVRMRSYLSGMPECKLGLNDKDLFEK
jgi:AP-1 complex subunit mu